jgi:hypothetical protein
MHLPEKGEVPGSNLGGGSETVIKIFCFKEKIRASKSPETVDAPGFSPDASIPLSFYGGDTRI